MVCTIEKYLNIVGFQLCTHVKELCNKAGRKKMYFKELGNIVFRDKIFSSHKLRTWIDIIKCNMVNSIEEGSIVGIIGSRNEMLICIIIACIESNITFIPLDKSIPSERISYMLENAGVKYLIGIGEEYESFKSRKLNYINYESLVIDNEKNNYYERETYNNPVYILYTSGSTGKPKGVMITYEGFMNFLSAIPKKIPFKKGEKIACFTTISFDIFFLESVLGLVSGMNLVLADDEERANPKSIIDIISKYKIDLVQMTPSMLKMIQVYNNGSLDFLAEINYLLLGGEQFADELLCAIHKFSSCCVYNLYGPTETTIWATISDLSRKSNCDLGEPIDGVSLYLVDENNRPVGNGMEGELLIGGKGLAIGYVNSPELTAERFVELEYGQRERVYKTGDVCKYDKDNNLIFVGRKDEQIKINGHRIELEEIEYWIKKQSGICDAAVCVKDSRLICFYISKEDANISQITESLKEFLPVYMIPLFYFRVDSFEYTLSHKLDKKKLLESMNKIEIKQLREDRIKETDANVKVGNRILSLLREKKEFINIDIEKESKLELLGLDSIGFVELVVAIENDFRIEFDEDHLVMNGKLTLNDLIEYVVMKVDEKQ